jgi:SAM-dependent methyltransferase
VQPSSDLAAIQDLLSSDSLDVSRDVLPDDPMYIYNPELYFHAGSDALEKIRLALVAAQRDSVGTILDFACGGGRVLRYLRAAFPEAAITGCDLYEAGLEFLAETFSVQPVAAQLDIDDYELEGPFDLIWVGSLFTHLGSDDWGRLLALFQETLSPRGVLVFTVYGRNIAQELRLGREKLDLKDEHIAQILREYDETGFGFFPDLNPEVNHGDALASRSWVCSKLDGFPQLQLVLYTENAWLGQDVIACVKAA